MVFFRHRQQEIILCSEFDKGACVFGHAATQWSCCCKVVMLFYYGHAAAQ